MLAPATLLLAMMALAGTVSAGFGPSPIAFTSPSTSLVLPVALRPLEQTQAAAEADISGESAEDPDEAAPDDEPDDVTESLITAPQITASAAAEAGRYAAREILQALHDLHPPVKTIQDAAAAQLLKRLCGRKREALTAEAARLCERFDALSGSSVQEKEDKEEVKPSEVKPQPIQDPSVCLPTTTTTTTTQCPICALFHAHAASHTHQHATDKGVQLDKKYNAALFWNSSVATESLTQHTTTECPCKARAREQALKQLQALQQQKALQLKEQQQSLQQALQQQQPLQQALQGVMQQALQPSGQSLTRSLMLLSNLLQNFQKEQNVPKPQPTPPPSPTTLKPMKPSSPSQAPQPPQSPQPLQPPQAPPKPSQNQWPPQLLPLLPKAKSALRSSSLMLLLSPDGARRVA